MTPCQRIQAPRRDGVETLTFVANARAKRSFNTILDAKNLFDRDGRSIVTTRVHEEGGERLVEIKAEHALQGGKVAETLLLSTDGGLRVLRLEREVLDDEGARTREERVDFTRGPMRMPETTYPEVLLPFVLRWQPFDGERRSIHAWIVDRFVARVYCEWTGKETLTVPAGRFKTLELTMYPDLNDWVSLGAMVNTLVRPFLPKYRMWFEDSDERRVVRFEGPYGPPGAPEVVLELAP